MEEQRKIGKGIFGFVMLRMNLAILSPNADRRHLTDVPE